MFIPKPCDATEQTRKGLHSLLYEGICSQIMGALTGGAFLIAFALSLGASNKVIGILAAIGPLAQLLQIPSIFLIDRLRLRKAITIVGALTSRMFWVAIAIVPFLPQNLQIPLFLLFLILYFALGSVSACSFNSWVRDFVPQKIMGRFFARRLAISTAIAAVGTVVGAVVIDLVSKNNPSNNKVYSALFFVGATIGMLGVGFFFRVPDPHLKHASAHGILPVLRQPFSDKNFRALLVYLGLWNFAVNLAAPFFTVFLLQELRFSMATVLALSILSQMVNALFLRIWGRLADRFSNKSILAVSGPLFMISIILWPFTTMPDPYFLTVPLVIIIHVLAGMSTAGVTLCSGNIALVTAPKGQSTAYLAVNALVSGIAAGVAPLIAGVSADWFADKELGIDFHVGTFIPKPEGYFVYALNFRGLDFLFVLSFLFGLFALERLVNIHEEGHVRKRVVVNEFFGEVRKLTRHVSNVAGLRQLTFFPYYRLRDLLCRRTNSEPEDSGI